MEIRKAKESDIKRLLEIYNYEVLHGVATLDLKEKTLEEWNLWYEEHQDQHHPLYVVEIDQVVAGYASLSEYRTKEAFRSTVELSIYIAPEFRQQGAASALMAFMVDYAKADEIIHNVVSVITSGNEASTRLHDRYGFQFCGTIPAVGYKKGKYQGIDNYCLFV